MRVAVLARSRADGAFPAGNLIPPLSHHALFRRGFGFECSSVIVSVNDDLDADLPPPLPAAGGA